MKTGIATCAMIVLALAIVACSPARAMLGGDSQSIHYKVTVTVDTPEGEKSASAVREASLATETSILPEQGGSFYAVTKGEAVVLDLGSRGVLFLLLGRESEARLIFDLFKKQGLQGPVTLEPGQYPMFVRFRDPQDPKTVENLLEFKPCAGQGGVPGTARCLVKDHFAEAFGVGVALKSVTVEMTDEPVTIGRVVERLPWLPARKGRSGTLGGGDSITEDPTNTWLNGAEFSAGVYW